MVIVILVASCAQLPASLHQACYDARQKVICETEEPVDPFQDPALGFFLAEGSSLENARFRLAYERANGCDYDPERPKVR